MAYDRTQYIAQISKRKNVNRDTRVRLLAIERMLRKDRYITASEIVQRLDLIYDIQVDRKTVYADMIAIDRFIPLEVKAGKHGGYRIMEVKGIYD